MVEMPQGAPEESRRPRRNQHRELGLARKVFGRPNLLEAEWEFLKLNGSEESKYVIERVKERNRDNTMRCRLRKRLDENPNDLRALHMLAQRGWTLADLPTSQHSQVGSHIGQIVKAAIIKQIQLLRKDFARFGKEKKLLKVSYFFRQRRNSSIEAAKAAAETPEEAKANKEGEEFILKVKDTRYIFRKWPADPRLPALIQDINDWMKNNLKSKYIKLVLPKISLSIQSVDVVPEASYGSYDGMRVMSELFGEFEEDARCDEQALTFEDGLETEEAGNDRSCSDESVSESSEEQ